jgi:hypothetical protein
VGRGRPAIALVERLGARDRVADIPADVLVADMPVEIGSFHQVSRLPPRAAQQELAP